MKFAQIFNSSLLEIFLAKIRSVFIFFFNPPCRDTELDRKNTRTENSRIGGKQDCTNWLCFIRVHPGWLRRCFVYTLPYKYDIFSDQANFAWLGFAWLSCGICIWDIYDFILGPTCKFVSRTTNRSMTGHTKTTDHLPHLKKEGFTSPL